MKRIVFFLFLLFHLFAYSQFSEDFTDTNLIENPEWFGNLDKFTVEDGWLQLNDSSAAGSGLKAYLSTGSVAIAGAEWQISVSANTNLTSGNYVRFYLVANKQNLTENLQGYFVMAGGTAKECALYRQEGNTTTKIIDGTDDRISGTLPLNFSLKVERSTDGEWSLYSKTAAETAFYEEGSVVDKTFTEACYSGVYVYYSSSNKFNYKFDDIVVTGNPYVPTSQNIVRHDIIFSEIMADPEPQIELPKAEYVELYNRTDSLLDLSGWKFSVGEKDAIINEGIIPAKGFLLLCAETNRLLFDGNIAKVSAFPTLTNSGQLLTLKNRNNEIVSWVEYSDKWYGNDAFKKDGGWSLERIDNTNLNVDEHNWKPSVSTKGGTPCAVNSVADRAEDFLEPKITAVEFVSASVLKIHFNKEMNAATLSNLQNYRADMDAVVLANVLSPKNNAVELTLDQEITEDELLTMAIENLSCISGFPLAENVHFAIPQYVDSRFVVINEILFNPVGDGVDFVEIYNRSDKTVNLSQLFLTKRKGDVFDVKNALTDMAVLFFPNEYLTLTTSPETVCSQFTCADGSKFMTVSLPSLPDDDGNIVVMLNNGKIIDELNYSAKMHHSLLQNSEGVSLERINPALPTNDSKTWHSASEESGYGTPGQRNSQYNSLEATQENKNFWVEHEVFSPDNDGNDDILIVHYQLPKNGFTATVTVYTPNGMKINKLYNNTLLDMEGVLQWDGQAASLSLCQIGVYVLFIEAVHLDGEVIRCKIPCVLSTSK